MLRNLVNIVLLACIEANGITHSTDHRARRLSDKEKIPMDFFFSRFYASYTENFLSMEGNLFPIV